MWQLRLADKWFDTRVAYAGHPTLFTIKLYHGGEFTKFPDVRYIGGTVNYVDTVDIEEFGIYQIDAILKGLRYPTETIMYYHYIVPGGDFHFGLRPLGCDADFKNFAQHVNDHKLMRIFIEHDTTNLFTYRLNPNPVRKVTLVQLDENVEEAPQVVEEAPQTVEEAPQTVEEAPQAVQITPPTIEEVPQTAENIINPLAICLSISPEFTRQRGWKKNTVKTSCSKKLFVDDDGGEKEQITNDFEEAANDFDIGLYQQILQSNLEPNLVNAEPNIGNAEPSMVNEVSPDLVNEIEVPNDYNDCNFTDICREDEYEEDLQAAIEVERAAELECQKEAELDCDMDADFDFDMDEFHFDKEGELEGDKEGELEGDKEGELEGDKEGELEGDTIGEVEVETEGGLEGDNEGANGSDSDSDYWVDDENIIEDVEVDMEDFYLNVDTEAEFFEKRHKFPTDNVNHNDEVPEELDVIDNEDWDSLEEDSDAGRKRRRMLKQLGRERRCSEVEVHKVTFHIGQKWKTKQELKNQIHVHSLETKKNIFFIKNNKTRLRAICKGKLLFNEEQVVGPTTRQKSKLKSKGKGKSAGKDKQSHVKDKTCPWVIQASRSIVEDNWYVKTYEKEHTCLDTRDIKSATAHFLSKQIMDQVELNPTVPVRALQDQLQKKYEVGFSVHKIFRAKSTARKFVVGDYLKPYELLRDYIMGLQSTNPDTTVRLEFEPEPNPNSLTRTFKRIYVCLGGMKKGFKACLRDFIGLNGAHLKGYFSGQILTAVGVDSNNGIYPLAYSIVETENTDSWKWFLGCLGDDLDIGDTCNYTFISNRQKGLQNAVSAKFPQAEHKFCLRHIHESMRRNWRTKEHKDHLWKCATATTVPEFNHLMSDFGNFDKQAYEWLKNIHPQHWERSHFSGRPVTDMLLNNLCEVFNNKLLEGRDKPVISCLEFIRMYMMKRICNVLKVQSKCVRPLTHASTKIFDVNYKAASQYSCRFSGRDKYEVAGSWQDQHVVDMTKHECNCRKWELTGIPCRHVLAVLFDKTDHGEDVGELHTYVHKVHWLETWKVAYAHNVEPIKGRKMWPISPSPIKIKPPIHKIQAGRPKKKRKMSMEERIYSQSQRTSQQGGASGSGSQQGEAFTGHGPHGTGKLTRKYIKVTCKKVQAKGSQC